MMRQLLSSDNLALVESVEVALDAQAIPYTVASTIHGAPPGTLALAVVDDRDYERALSVVREVEQSFPTSRRTTRTLVRLLQGALLVIIVLLIIAGLQESMGW
jgi:hypothetical protein